MVNDDYHLYDGHGRWTASWQPSLWPSSSSFPPPPQWPSLLLPVGHAILAFLSFFPGTEGGLQWPRQTLFGKQVTILSGSIFLPVPFPPRPRAQLQNFLNSNPSVEFNGASENELPFHLPYLLPSISLACYKALVAFHNHSVSDLNCTVFHSPTSPLSTLPPHLFVGPVGSPLGMGLSPSVVLGARWDRGTLAIHFGSLASAVFKCL